jgi:flagellar protein FlaG
VADPRQTGVGKISAIASVKPLQELPQGGKELPQGKASADDAESNIDDAVKALNDHVQQLRRELQFSVDEDSGRTIIKVLDMETKQIIRQIPPEDALNFARRLNEGGDLEIVDTYI